MKRSLLGFSILAAVLAGVCGFGADKALATATLYYDLRYATTYDSSMVNIGRKDGIFFHPDGWWYFWDGSKNNPTWMHRFDLYASVGGLAQYEDLSQISFGFSFVGGVTDSGKGFKWNWASTVTWNPDPLDPDGGDIITPIFATAGDSGVQGDMRGLMATINAGAACAAQFGEASPGLIGSVYCQWNGTSFGELTVFGDPPGGSTWVTWLDNRWVNGRGYSTSVDASVRPVEMIPESATLAMLALGGLALRRGRRVN